MSTDTQEIFDRLKAVCEAATDEPWRQWETLIGTPMPPPLDDDIIIRADCKEDAHLIALSRTALPALVEALERILEEFPPDEHEGKWIRALVTVALAPLKEVLK